MNIWVLLMLRKLPGWTLRGEAGRSEQSRLLLRRCTGIDRGRRLLHRIGAHLRGTLLLNHSSMAAVGNLCGEFESRGIGTKEVARSVGEGV